ncbi:MAG: peptidoglycan DD-metalloendopeptidase family protein [Chloroflexi bacterium]|nr:peptidoglycan DD-metalloendopeptidase family protein [Chloroflexota bacterium]MCI0576404.1 peptidoglycan DD-metalloendopeptidase family protein [Chloroflexota bacterium]MCI0644276.1 peptidoglycan DD-metalloendopeptidase family protein [Chloroflexota bacterium]MCI0726259.1 peptidoglycan DD-metalloendopeptidase family protein [Chloroflexota bacterium]
MKEQDSLWQRYGGHLVLLVVALLLFIGGRIMAAGGLFNVDLESEPLPAEGLAAPATAALAVAPTGPAPAEAVIDLSGVPVLINNSLSPNLNPFTYQGQQPEHNLITYTVEAGDTPNGIAEQFNIEPETLLGGNPFLSEESSALQTGTVLTILPIDGVLHDVQEGDTLEALVGQYGIPAEDIIAYEPNNLEFPYRLYPGTQILVPGAVRELFVWTAPSLPPTSDSTGSGIAPLIQGTGTFIWPVGYRRITQYYWYGHQAIDIGLPEGSAVVAADTGTVTWAGWNVYGYGNLIVVNHGNGYETYYGHLSSVYVVPGQIVYQGNTIGASGNTGRSSGPHLHFEIRYFNTLLDPLGILR